MCSGHTGVVPSLACLRLGRCGGPKPHQSIQGLGVIRRDSYVRVFTAVGALRRLRWRKARVPLAFLAVALTCGDQDECLWSDTPRYFAVSVSASVCSCIT